MRLLSSTPDEIIKLLKDMENNSKVIREQCRIISFYSRGSLTYDNALMLCALERKEWHDMIIEIHDKEHGGDKIRQELI